MNKKLVLGVAAFCTLGLSAGAWAADAATADEVVAKVKAAAVGQMGLERLLCLRDGLQDRRHDRSSQR